MFSGLAQEPDTGTPKPICTLEIMTRIVAGSLGGRRLAVPPGARTRPTSDRVREALFSALESLTDLDRARFVDLYAGSGAVGLEAYSRGAGHVLLVEADPRVARVARENIAALGAGGAVRLAVGPVGRVLAEGPDEPYDIVFADPPYAVPDEEVTAMLAALVDGGWLAARAVVVVERSSRGGEPGWPRGVTPVRTRRYGETTLWYGRATEGGPDEQGGFDEQGARRTGQGAERAL
jgi:16S rRNA (guanine(966)-N(2))-methyltransferase RsmD